MKEHEVYKVVSMENGAYYSASVSVPEMRVVYTPYEFVSAPVGGLLCFKTAYEAYRYAQFTQRKLHVWRGTGRYRVTLPPVQRIMDVLAEADDIRRIWESRSPELDFAPWKIDSWPDGTVAYKQVRLDALIYWPGADDLTDPAADQARARELARVWLSRHKLQEFAFYGDSAKVDRIFYEMNEIAHGGGTVSRGQAIRAAKYSRAAMDHSLERRFFEEVFLSKWESD